MAPTTAQANQARTGGTNFASVLASILGESRTATPEQYATFVALVARRLGVPARVATGFRLPTHGAATVAPNTYTVTTADAWTWVELWIQGQGWTVLDPSPDNGSTQNITSSQGAKATSTQTTVAPTQVLVTQPSGFPQIGPAAPHDLGRDSGLTVTDVLALVLIAIGVVIVVILLILLLRKRLRVRRRRRPGDPRRRLLGAWQEGLDVLAEAGLPDTSAKTSSEIADATREMFGPESGQQVRLLGDAANAALFNSTSWVQSQDADGAWETQSALRRAVHDRLSLRERVGAGLRYHRPQRNRTVTGPSSWAAAARSRGQEPRRRAQHTVARSGRRTH